MKKAVGIILAASIVFAMTACGKTPGISTNSVFKEDKMVTINGSEYTPQNELAYAEKNLGFGITYTGTFAELRSEGRLGDIVLSPYCMALKYTSGKANEIECSVIDPKNLSDENIEIFSELLSREKAKIAGVFRYPGEEASDTESCFAQFKEWFAEVDKLTGFNGDTYYFGYNDEFDKMTLTDDEKADLSNLVKEIKDFRNGICIFPSEIDVSMGGSVSGNLSNFSTDTLDGRTVTQDILKDYDLTMVNIWATWCSACVSEMPELAELYGRLPENVNMLTICTDCRDETELANEIYQSSNGSFPVLFENDDIRNSLTGNIQTLPTTIFVDKDGRIVGRAIIGVPRGNTVDYYLNAINDALNSI